MKMYHFTAISFLAISAVFPRFSVADTNEEKDQKPEKPAYSVAATLDVKNSAEGSIPGGASVKVGKWSVDAKASKLRIMTKPLVEGWLEFGPEIRERSATVSARMKVPGKGRLKSRGGVGLYGKNGFQLRMLPVSNQIEIVRRGEQLAVARLDLDSEKLYAIELAVLEEEDRWTVRGRVWETRGERPKNPQITTQFFLDELQFPLAGRTVIRATPFSGLPVLVAGAKVFYGEYDPPVEKQKKPAEEVEETKSKDDQETE